MKKNKRAVALIVTVCILMLYASTVNVFADISTSTAHEAIVHTNKDAIKGKSSPSETAKTVAKISMEDDLHVLSVKDNWVEVYIDTGKSCVRAWLKRNQVVYADSVRAPIDLTYGSWYFLTYPNHGAESGETYQEYAVDINLPGNLDEGLPVYAIADGVVTLDIRSNGSIRICHEDPVMLRSGTVLESYTFFSWYGHMKDICVRKGDYVKKGDVIGYISNTTEKYAGLSPHLHFAVGASIEPYGSPVIPISSYWLAESPLADGSLYCDNEYGIREPEGLYEDGILNDSSMP